MRLPCSRPLPALGARCAVSRTSSQAQNSLPSTLQGAWLVGFTKLGGQEQGQNTTDQKRPLQGFLRSCWQQRWAWEGGFSPQACRGGVAVALGTFQLPPRRGAWRDPSMGISMEGQWTLTQVRDFSQVTQASPWLTFRAPCL